jgi:hypothetical protein
MKLQELKEAIYIKINGTNTSGCNHYEPRLFLANGKEIYWKDEPDGTHIDDGGFWHHDTYCLIPFGEKVYMPSRIEFVGDDPSTIKMKVLEWIEFDIETAEQGSTLIISNN